MRSPRGDQAALVSVAASNVARAINPRVTSPNQISVLEFWVVSNATRLPSGENDGDETSPGCPKVPSTLPVRSTHVSWPMADCAPPTNVNTPVSDSEYESPAVFGASLTCSAIGVGSAAPSDARDGSNGWANSVF